MNSIGVPEIGETNAVLGITSNGATPLLNVRIHEIELIEYITVMQCVVDAVTTGIHWTHQV